MSNTTFQIPTDWDKVKERLKENDGSLTDEDLDYKDGDALIEHLAQKMGRSKEHIIGYVESMAVNKDKAG